MYSLNVVPDENHWKRGRPESTEQIMSDKTFTSEAASSCRDEIYRVATTLSPSVTQKFIRLG